MRNYCYAQTTFISSSNRARPLLDSRLIVASGRCAFDNTVREGTIKRGKALRLAGMAFGGAHACDESRAGRLHKRPPVMRRNAPYLHAIVACPNCANPKELRT